MQQALAKMYKKVNCYYLLNVCLISRRYWFRSDSRVGWWQVNGEASRRCHCLRINRRRLRMSCHIARLIADCWRLRFTVDGGTRWDVSLRVEVLSIWVWLRDECWIPARCSRRRVVFHFQVCSVHFIKILTAFVWLWCSTVSHSDLDSAYCSRHLIPMLLSSFDGHPAYSLLLFFCYFSVFKFIAC